MSGLGHQWKFVPGLGSPDRTGTDSLQADKAGTSGGCQGGQGCRAAPESPETVGVEFAVAGPEVIAGEKQLAVRARSRAGAKDRRQGLTLMGVDHDGEGLAIGLLAQVP